MLGLLLKFRHILPHTPLSVRGLHIIHIEESKKEKTKTKEKTSETKVKVKVKVFGGGGEARR